MLDVRNRLCSLEVGPDSCLYRDEQGRAVVFASETETQLAVLGCRTEVLVAEDWPSGGALVAPMSGRLCARLGPACTLKDSDFEPFTGTHVGRGWIAPGSQVKQADGIELGAAAPFALPFQSSCDVDGAIWIAPTLTERFEFEFACTNQPDRAARRFQAEAETAPYMTETGTYRCHLGPARFTVEFEGNQAGLVVSKTYDRFYGRQRARVWVDDVYAGVWAAYEEDRVDRHASSDFIVSEALLQGKASVTITIDPPAGSPLWTWQSYSIRVLAKIG